MFARTLRGRAATARLTTDTPPDSATVTITRADGTALATDRAATPDATGATVALTGAELAELDLLTLSWTTVTGAETETHETVLEIVGGFLFSLAELRRVDPLGDETTYTDEDLERARLLAETALEDACGVAFVPRFRRELLDGAGTDAVLVRPEARRVIASSLDDTPLDATQLAALDVDDAGVVYNVDGWTAGRRNVVVAYEHGYRYPPQRVVEAAKLLARHALVDSPVDDRAISVTNEDGNVAVFVQAGVRGAVFAIPEANAVVEQYGVRGVA